MENDQLNKVELSKKAISVLDRLNACIDVYVMDLMKDREKEEAYLNYPDMQALTRHIKNFFCKNFGSLPAEICVACDAAEIPLAPTKVERIKLLKNLKATCAGTLGFGAIIYALGMAFGWGASAIAYFIAFLTGTSLLGPLGWGIGGVTLVMLAGLLKFGVGDKNKQSERALRALKEGLSVAVEQVYQRDKSFFGEEME